MPKMLDLTGTRFGQLEVVGEAPRDASCSRYRTWECVCSCGNTVYANSNQLRRGLLTDCGCMKRDNLSGLDITGRRYGKLIALNPTGKRNHIGSVVWRCRCECGNEVEVAVSELSCGRTKSCGCLKKKYQQLVHDRLQLVDGTCVEWLVGRKSRRDNTSGFRGIYKKENGKYCASIGFKKKIYYIGIFDEYEEAVKARLRAEEEIHDGFLKAYGMWKSAAEKDPEWAEKNPFRFEVTKINGSLVIENSMESLMKGG